MSGTDGVGFYTERMKVRVGYTEWPSVTAWVQDMVLCVLLNRHDLEQHDDLRPSCRRCGVVPRFPSTKQTRGH